MGQSKYRQRKLTREDKKLAKRIREVREKKGISQQKLSMRLGANPSYIAYVETYRRGLSLLRLYNIAKVLGVEVRELFTF